MRPKDAGQAMIMELPKSFRWPTPSRIFLPDDELRIFYETRCAHLLRLGGQAREADLQLAGLEVWLRFQQAAEEFIGDTDGATMVYLGHGPC